MKSILKFKNKFTIQHNKYIFIGLIHKEWRNSPQKYLIVNLHSSIIHCDLVLPTIFNKQNVASKLRSLAFINKNAQWLYNHIDAFYKRWAENRHCVIGGAVTTCRAGIPHESRFTSHGSTSNPSPCECTWEASADG